MPRSIQMQLMCALRAWPQPTNCKNPTLRDVAISTMVLPRFNAHMTCKFDIYHFCNERTDEWLTVCIGMPVDFPGNVNYVYLQKGRIMTSVEDLANMEAFAYADESNNRDEVSKFPCATRH